MKQNARFEEISFPKVAEASVTWGPRESQRQTKDYKALVNPNTGKLYAIASRQYQIIRHEEAIERLERALSKKPELGPRELETDFYNDGGRMRRTYRFPAISVQVGIGDPVSLELHLYNSYDLTWPFQVLLGAFRFVCSNGLVIGNAFLRLRKRHVYRLEALDLEREIAAALEEFTKQTDQWKTWKKRSLTDTTYEKVLETMSFGKKALAQVTGRVGKEVQKVGENNATISLWVFYNVLTWYITHCAVSLNHRVQMERRLRAAVSKYF